MSKDECLAEILDCQVVLNGRFTLPKGSTPVRMVDLKARILRLWKTDVPSTKVSLGKGYF